MIRVGTKISALTTLSRFIALPISSMPVAILGVPFEQRYLCDFLHEISKNGLYLTLVVRIFVVNYHQSLEQIYVLLPVLTCKTIREVDLAIQTRIYCDR
jgi:hypothetical protein